MKYFSKSTKFLIILIILLPSFAISASAPWVGYDLKDAPCKTHGQGYGPFDYLLRNQLPKHLNVVEKHHFTPKVEQLISGESVRHPLPDIHYTLMAWPNHHRALNSAMRYQLRNGYKSMAASSPVECYLQRAINFSPNDDTVYMLYGIFLHHKTYSRKALSQYRKALAIKPSNAQVKYNLALLLVELGQLKEANQFAQELYSRGYPLQGLKKKLLESGKWKVEEDIKP